jgi:hypothetical protein
MMETSTSLKGRMGSQILRQGAVLFAADALCTFEEEKKLSIAESLLTFQSRMADSL